MAHATVAQVLLAAGGLDEKAALRVGSGSRGTLVAMGMRRKRRNAALAAVIVALLVSAGLAVLGAVPGFGEWVAQATAWGGRTPAAGSTAYVPDPGPATLSSTSAPGVTEGTVAPSPLTVVALGDSVPAASVCNCTGYVEQLTAMLQRTTHRPGVVHNDAVGGWTTSDVEQDLQAPGTRADLAQADLVVIEVGANDFDLSRVDDPACLPAATSPCWSQTIANLRAGLSRIISTIKGLDQRPLLRIAVAGYWNVTVDGAVGRQRGEDFVTGSDNLTRLVNQAIDDVAVQGGALYIDAYAALKGVNGDQDPTASLAADGDHPNAQGHQLLAQELYDTLVAAGAIGPWRAG